MNFFSPDPFVSMSQTDDGSRKGNIKNFLDCPVSLRRGKSLPVFPCYTDNQYTTSFIPSCSSPKNSCNVKCTCGPSAARADESIAASFRECDASRVPISCLTCLRCMSRNAKHNHEMYDDLSRLKPCDKRSLAAVSSHPSVDGTEDHFIGATDQDVCRFKSTGKTFSRNCSGAHLCNHHACYCNNAILFTHHGSKDTRNDKPESCSVKIGKETNSFVCDFSPRSSHVSSEIRSSVSASAYHELATDSFLFHRSVSPELETASLCSMLSCNSGRRATEEYGFFASSFPAKETCECSGWDGQRCPCQYCKPKAQSMDSFLRASKSCSFSPRHSKATNAEVTPIFRSVSSPWNINCPNKRTSGCYYCCSCTAYHKRRKSFSEISHFTKSRFSKVDTASTPERNNLNVVACSDNNNANSGAKQLEHFCQVKPNKSGQLAGWADTFLLPFFSSLNPQETLDLSAWQSAKASNPPLTSFTCAVEQGAPVPKVGYSGNHVSDSKNQTAFIGAGGDNDVNSPASSDFSPVDVLLPKELTTMIMHNLSVSIKVKASSSRYESYGVEKWRDEELLSKKKVSAASLREEMSTTGWQKVKKMLCECVLGIGSLCGVPVPCAEIKRSETILKGLCGTFIPGRLVAILGPSGSGKSTLLNVLAGRLEHTGGQLKVNATEITCTEELRHFTAFVQQLDLFLPNLTVEEHLSTQVQLRLDKKMTAAKRKELITDVMTKFGLYKVRDVPIGASDVSYGISGGERKRLSVASATLTNPFVLLADEPTTGLDSVMANSVVSALRRLAASGRTVVASLHQPSTAIFAMCDEVLLLAEGRIVYFGDRLGSVEWMRRLGMLCPKYANPSDFLIRCVSLPENPKERASKLRLVHQWADKWEETGDAFLREWTEHGRLAFFHSSRSFAEHSIEMGLYSGTARSSRAVSPEPSLWGSSRDSVVLIDTNEEENVAHSVPCNSGAWSQSHPSSRQQTSVQRKGVLGAIAAPLLRSSTLIQDGATDKARHERRNSSLTTNEEQQRQGCREMRTSDILCGQRASYNDVPGILKAEAQQSGSVHTSASESTMLTCFDTFYSAPAATSLSYMLVTQPEVDDTRKQLSAETTKALLRAFRYSGPRPHGHRCERGNNAMCPCLHLSNLPHSTRPNTACCDQRYDSVLGKPILLRCHEKAAIPHTESKAKIKEYVIGVPEHYSSFAYRSRSLLRSTVHDRPATADTLHIRKIKTLPLATTHLVKKTHEENRLAQNVSNSPKSQPSSLESESCVHYLMRSTPTWKEEHGNEQAVPRRQKTQDAGAPEHKEMDHLAVPLQDEELPRPVLKRHGFCYQLRVLTCRALTSNRRDPILLYARGLQTLVIAVMYGSMFFNLGGSFADAKSKVSALFFVLTNQGLVGAAGVCSTFPSEKVVISREREGGFVDTRAYIVAKMLADVPIQCVFPVLFNIITILMMNLCSGWRCLLLTCVVALAVCNSAITVGYLGSAAAPSSDVALIVAQIWVLPALLFSGFIILFDDIPKPLSWMQYLSYFRYGFLAYAQLIFDGLSIPYRPGVQITGSQFIKSYLGITLGGTSYFWTQIGYLVLMIVIFRLATILIVVPFAKSWREKPS